MEITMDNENDKPQGVNFDPDENSHEDEVPAWLQGIDKPDLDDTSPNEPIHEDTWVKETLQDNAETAQEVTGVEAFLPPKTSLPEWLSQLSNVDSETHSHEESPETISGETSDNFEALDDTLTETETKGEQKDDPDEMNVHQDFQVNPPEDSAEDEGFIEISEFEIVEIPEPFPISDGTEDSEDEELPPWLDEMIAEPIDELIDNDTAEEAQLDEKEPSEPFDVYLDAQHFEDEGTEMPQETNLTIPNETIQDDLVFSIIEGDTQPVIMQSESFDTSEPSQESQETIREQSEELPKTLMFAKHLLDQSEFEPAKKILTTYIEKSKYVDVISQWLWELVNQRAEANSGVWELLGDIALQDDDPEQALSAYSQAITILVSEKKGVNESD